MCKYEGLVMEMGINCNKCDRCGINDARNFLKASIPVEIFKVQNSEKPFAAIKLSNRVSTNIIALLGLKVDTIKDMMFADEKFPIPVYSALEYFTQIASHSYLRIGLWLRDLAGSGILCPVANRIIKDTYEMMLEILREGIREFYPDFFDDAGRLWGAIEGDFRKEIESLQPPKDIEDYYHIAGEIFIPLYKLFDRFCYLITSYTSLKEGKKIIYVHKSWQDKLKEFFRELVLKTGYPEKICIISKELTYDVEVIKKEMKIDAMLC